MAERKGLFSRFRRAPKALNSVQALTPFNMSNNKYLSEFPTHQSFFEDMEAYAANEILYACSRLRMNTTGEIKFDILNGENAVETGPIYERIKSPDGVMTLSDWLSCFQLYYDLTGNVYVLRETDEFGGTFRWTLLRPDRMFLYPTSEVGGYYWQYQVDGNSHRFSLEDVHHFKAPNPTNDWFGIGPVEICSQMLHIDNMQSKLVYSFMKNAAAPAGFLKVERDFETEAEYEQFRQQMRQSVADVQAGNYGVLYGKMDYLPVGQFQAPEQMLVRQQTETRVCAVMGVDPRLVGVNAGVQASSGNVDFTQARKTFAEYTMMPLWKRLEQFIQMMVAADFGESSHEIKLNTTDVRSLQESESDKISRAAQIFSSGLATLNEGRELANLPPLDDEELGNSFAKVQPQPQLGMGNGGLDLSKLLTQSNVELEDNYPFDLAAIQQVPVTADDLYAALDKIDITQLNDGSAIKLGNLLSDERRRKELALLDKAVSDGKISKRKAAALKALPRIVREGKRGAVEGALGTGGTFRYRVVRGSAKMARAGLIGGTGDLQAEFIKEIERELKLLDGRWKAAARQWTRYLDNPARFLRILSEIDQSGMDAVVQKYTRLAIERGYERIEDAFERVVTKAPADIVEGALNRISPHSEGFNKTAARAVTGVAEKSYKAAVTKRTTPAGHTIRTVRPSAFLETSFKPDVIEDEVTEAVTQYLETSTRVRARAIVRSFIRMGFTFGITSALSKEGVGHVLVIDGTANDLECAQANGQIWTLEQAEQNPIGHPNCQRRFIPVEDEKEVELHSKDGAKDDEQE